MPIYLVSDTGIVKCNEEAGAKAAEAVGFRRCTRQEYQAKRRWQQRQERKETL